MRPARRILFSGFGGRKAPNRTGRISIAGCLRLRAIELSVCRRSVRRFAQDDVFVGVLKQKHPKQVSAYGAAPRAFSDLFIVRLATEMSLSRSSFLCRPIVDLSVWQDVQGLGILYLSVIAGEMNLNVCELTKEPGTP